MRAHQGGASPHVAGADGDVPVRRRRSGFRPLSRPAGWRNGRSDATRIQGACRTDPGAGTIAEPPAAHRPGLGTRYRDHRPCRGQSRFQPAPEAGRRFDGAALSRQCSRAGLPLRVSGREPNGNLTMLWRPANMGRLTSWPEVNMKPRAISILFLVLALATASVVTTAEDRKANVLLQSGNAKVTLRADLKGAIT